MYENQSKICIDKKRRKTLALKIVIKILLLKIVGLQIHFFIKLFI